MAALAAAARPSLLACLPSFGSPHRQTRDRGHACVRANVHVRRGRTRACTRSPRRRHTRAAVPTRRHTYIERAGSYTYACSNTCNAATHTPDLLAPANHARTCLRAEQLSGKERASFLPFANFASRAFPSSLAAVLVSSFPSRETEFGLSMHREFFIESIRSIGPVDDPPRAQRPFSTKASKFPRTRLARIREESTIRRAVGEI